MRTIPAQVLFAVLCVGCLGIATGYLVHRRSSSNITPDGVEIPAVATAISVLGDRPAVLFSSSAFDRTNGFLGMATIDGEATKRFRIDLRCERVHFAKGVGLCLSASRGVITSF